MMMLVFQLPAPNLNNIKVDTFSPVQFIVLIAVVLLLSVAYAVVNSFLNGRSKYAYARALLELSELLKEMNVNIDAMYLWIGDIRRGVTKEATFDQAREYAVTKINALLFLLKRAAVDIKRNNNLTGNERKIRGKTIDLSANLFNNMCISFDLFLFHSLPLSCYLDENFIEVFADVIFEFVYGDNESEDRLERNLKIVADRMFNEFADSLIVNEG
jgi:hypothetical protein